MRLFEALTIVFVGQLTLAVAVLGPRRPRRANLLALVPLAPLAAHLALEGYRWQMAPAYIAALGLCLAGILRYARPAAPGLGAVGSRLGAVMGFFLLMASVATCTLFP